MAFYFDWDFLGFWFKITLWEILMYLSATTYTIIVLLSLVLYIYWLVNNTIHCYYQCKGCGFISCIQGKICKNGFSELQCSVVRPGKQLLVGSMQLNTQIEFRRDYKCCESLVMITLRLQLICTSNSDSSIVSTYVRGYNHIILSTVFHR